MMGDMFRKAYDDTEKYCQKKYNNRKKGRKMETIQSIIEFETQKYQGIEFSLALDIFQDSVENYKRATKRQKLSCVAKAFINACLVLSIDYLTGSQALEVVNNLSTDLETDKETLEKAINKQMKKERKDYEKNQHNRTWLGLIRMCKRANRK